jgi:hypothetical protein
MNLSDLCRSVRDEGLPALLVGGHAMIAHGHPRNTFDLDVVVPRPSVEAWRAFAMARGYTIHHEGPAFVQFDPPDTGSWPLDLMVVGQDTFDQFVAQAVAVPGFAAGQQMVCLKHLLALKAHAIRHGHAGRVERDVDDVIGLVRVNQFDVTAPEWRELFLKHGRRSCMRNSSKSEAKVEPEELALPDWSGADDSPRRISPEAAFALCERYAAEMPEVVARLRRQWREPCPVEFVW